MVTQSAKGLFLSYASEDAGAAKRISDALRVAGIEVWFDQSELRGGDAWDQKIRQQIRDCALFVPIISAHTQARPEGYFRLEWKLAVDRSHLMAAEKAFIVPVVVDATTEPEALVPAQFRDVQWIRLRADEVQGAFVNRIAALLEQPVAPRAGSPERVVTHTRPRLMVNLLIALSVAVVAALVAATATRGGWLSHKPVPKVDAGTASVSVVTPPAVISASSVAVLPFVDMSKKKDQQYFSDGLSEDLITALSQLPGLKVIGRTSSFRFRDSKDDSLTIGGKLGVARLLEGSVRHSGAQVRVNAELINTSDGSTVWSERYDRPYRDLFRLQDDLTSAVAAALRPRLIGSVAAVSSREPASMNQADRPPSGNLQAYSAVLEGKYYLARETDGDTRKAIERFTRATQLDSGYAVAWSLLSRAWTDIGAYHVDLALAPDAYSKARAAVRIALSIAPDMTSTHIARGWLLEMAELDWRGAEAEYRRALELAPGSGDAAAGVARQLANFGQLERAVGLTRQALAADPLHSRWYGWLAIYLGALNRLEEAEEAIRRAIELQPGGVRLHLIQTDIEIHRGNAQSALAAAQQEPPGQFRDAALAKALQIGTDRNAADAALKNLLEKDASWDPYDVAQIYAVRGEADKTFEWLDRARSYRDPAVHYVSYDPIFARYKDDPRFAAYCRNLGLPVPGEVRVPK